MALPRAISTGAPHAQCAPQMQCVQVPLLCPFTPRRAPISSGQGRSAYEAGGEVRHLQHHCSTKAEAALWTAWFRERARRFPEHFSDPSHFDKGLGLAMRPPLHALQQRSGLYASAHSLQFKHTEHAPSWWHAALSASPTSLGPLSCCTPLCAFAGVSPKRAAWLPLLTRVLALVHAMTRLSARARVFRVVSCPSPSRVPPAFPLCLSASPIWGSRLSAQ